MPRLSIILPVFAPRLLPACLASLARNCPESISCEIILVLNEARSETLQAIDAGTLDIQIICSPVNLGLAGAANRGRSVAQGELLLILHDDAEVEPGWMEGLVAAADAHPEAGAIGGKVLSLDGSLQNAGMILWRDATVSTPWIGEAPSAGEFNQLRAVDYCGTSSLLVRSEVWDAVGGLDEQFYPVYYVDVDLSMALRRLGRIVLYEPKSCIRHHRGGATGADDYRWFITHRNRARFLAKWSAELEQQEPREETINGIRRAVTRAEAFADLCRRNLRPIRLQSRQSKFDPLDQELLHREKNRALREAYAAHLIRDLNTETLS